MTVTACAHCGRACGITGGYAHLPDGRRVCHPDARLPDGRQARHPSDSDRPDCYYLTTVYHQPVGNLRPHHNPREMYRRPIGGTLASVFRHHTDACRLYVYRATDTYWRTREREWLLTSWAWTCTDLHPDSDNGGRWAFDAGYRGHPDALTAALAHAHDHHGAIL